MFNISVGLGFQEDGIRIKKLFYIYGVKIIKLITELTSYRNTVLFFENAVNFLFTQSEQHVLRT